MITEKEASEIAEKEVKAKGYFSYKSLKKNEKYGYVFLFHFNDPLKKHPMPTGLPIVGYVKDGKIEYVTNKNLIFKLIRS
ncbi:hypothetical protein SAMN05720761_1091 [Fibrobacter sp. UWCM]|nr:hypothetical protein SAMN05720761_1091 [Fibrobacter sp. UWCM]